MNAIEQGLSSLGTAFPHFAWSMFWQSGLLIGLLFVIDFLLGRKLRPALRYALWLLILLKLVLPPSLAFPTGIAWWVRPTELGAAPARAGTVIVRYGESEPAPEPSQLSEPVLPGQSHIPRQSWLIASLAGTVGLLAWMLGRWRQVAKTAASAKPAPQHLQRLLQSCCDWLQFRGSVRLRMTEQAGSPVVFGFFWPVILLPTTLPSRLSESQLRTVLFHELIHLRRGDVWINCVQTLLQIAYWWHPLLWPANARLRRIREEAVDDAVMLALRGEEEAYPQALLEVAKLAVGRRPSSLARIGILETRHALRRRIERLVNLGPPKKGLALASLACFIALGALALPMGQAPATMTQVSATLTGPDDKWPDPRFPALKESKPSERAQAADPAPGQKPAELNEETGTNYPGLITSSRQTTSSGPAGPGRDERGPLTETNGPQNETLFTSALSQTERVPGRRDRGTSPQAILRMLNQVRLNTISFDNQPLSEVLITLNDTVSPVFTFRLEAAASSRRSTLSNQDLGNIPIRILPALTDVRLGDVLDAIVKVAPQRIRYSIETNEVVFALVTSKAKVLYTRIIKVNSKAFLQALEQASGETNVGSAFRAVLRAQGLDLQPPETFFFSDGNGQMLLHTTLEKLGPIEQIISELVTPPSQLNIKTRFLRLPDSLFNLLRSSLGSANTLTTNSAKILSPAQTAELLHAIDSKPPGRLLNSASVTTLSGRQAEVQCVEPKSVLSNNVPVQIPLGPAIDLIPRLGPEGWKISLKIVASLREFLGYVDPGGLAATENPGGPSIPTGPVPEIRLKRMNADTTVPDGYTVVLVNPLDAQGKPLEKLDASELHYVVLVTPTVVDGTGQRLHTDAEIEALSR